MFGGAPIPIVNNKNESPKEARILSIADLEEEGSKKLPRLARGEFSASLTIAGSFFDSKYPDYLHCLLLLFCFQILVEKVDRSLAY